jgi:hypothetical protein
MGQGRNAAKSGRPPAFQLFDYRQYSVSFTVFWYYYAPGDYSRNYSNNHGEDNDNTFHA